VAKSADIRKWAVIGADMRLWQLREEMEGILGAFPELRGDRTAGRRRGRPPASPAPAEQPQSEPEPAAAAAPASVRPGRRRRQLSAAGRKRISDAQKARWAKLRSRSRA